MKFHKLYYRMDQYSPMVELDFSEQQTDEFNQVWAYCGSNEQINAVKLAFDKCLSENSSHNKIYFAKLELYDNLGREWQIEYNEKTRVVLQNSKVLDETHGFAEFSNAILQSLKITTDDQNIKINNFELSYFNNEVVSFTKEQDSKMSHFLLQNIEKRKQELYKNLYAKIKILKDLDIQKVENFVSIAFPVTQQFNGICAQIEKLTTEHVNKNYGVPETNFNFQQQLDIVLKVEKLYEELAAPGASITNQKESVTHLEQEIAELLNSMQLETLPSIKEMPNWSEAFNVLCRIHVLEKLVRYTSKVTDVAQNEVNPVFDNLIDTIVKIVDQQEQYSEEIQSTISSINVQLAAQNITIAFEHDKYALDKKTPTQTEKVEIVLGWFEKLKAKMASEENSINKNKEEKKTQDLETLRLSLEFLLASFSESRALLTRMKNDSKNEMLTEINGSYDKQVVALGKAKQEWRKLQIQHGLQENMTLKQFMLLAVNYMRIIELQEKKQLVEEQIHQRKGKLKQLADLVDQWRKSNNSQKYLDLENSAVLLSEARTIIRYKDERLKKVDMQEKLSHQAKDDRRLLLLLQDQLEQIQKDWKNVCFEFGMEQLNIDDNSCEELFVFSHKIKELRQFAEKNAPTNFNETLRKFNHNPISVWTWSEQLMTNQARINFLKVLENSESGNGVNLYLLNDPTLVEFMIKLGVGHVKSFAKEKAKVNLIAKEQSSNLNSQPTSSTVQSQTLQRRIIKSAQTPMPQTVVAQPLVPNGISPKARAVLDLLNNRKR